MDLSPATALIAAAVMAVGSALQAATGIGLSMFVVPVLAVLDPAFIPGPQLFGAAVLTALTAFRDRAIIRTRLRPLGLSLAGLALGTAAGALLFDLLAGPLIAKVFGVLVLLAVLLSVFGPPVRATATSLPLAGGASGVMGTMVGIHGPPIALVFQNAEPAEARALLSAFFVVACSGAVLALALVGHFGLAELLRGLVLVPGALVGFAVAPFFARFIDRRRLRIVILTVSTVSALVLLLR